MNFNNLQMNNVAPTMRRLATGLFLCIVLLSGTIKLANAKGDDATTGAITALDAKVAAWNKHDLETVLSAYADSADLSIMSTGNDLYGKKALSTQYEKWYGKNHNLMGKIGYSDLKSKVLGKQSVLLTGHYTLEEPKEEPVRGVFTLLYSKQKNGWKIIHEHLSKSLKK